MRVHNRAGESLQEFDVIHLLWAIFPNFYEISAKSEIFRANCDNILRLSVMFRCFSSNFENFPNHKNHKFLSIFSKIFQIPDLFFS